jgi:lipoprotein-anchoring transpeptidase ErfK/SrfK
MAQQIRFTMIDASRLLKHIPEFTQQKCKRPKIWVSLLLAFLSLLVCLRYIPSLLFADTFTPTPKVSLQPKSIYPATPIPVQFKSLANIKPKIVGEIPPFPTDIVPGYPDPRVDSTSEQQMRTQISNPSKVIMVSIQGQFLQAFENNKIVRWSYVTTGRVGMDTPQGVFTIFNKVTPVTFLPLSTDPKSVYFGFPSIAQYGLEFAEGGYYIHDAWWRTIYGPGLTTEHWDPGREEYQTGSHGCVNTPLEMMAWLYLWAPVGTKVIIF